MDIKNLKIEGFLKIKNVNPLDENQVYSHKSIEIFKNNETRTKIHSDFWRLLFRDVLFGKQYFKNPYKNFRIEDILIGLGNGVTTDFMGICKNFPFTVLEEANVELVYTEGGTSKTIVMDETDGTFSGEDIESGVFDVLTGEFDIAFLNAPDDNTPILINATSLKRNESLNSGFFFSLTTSANPNIKTDVDFSEIIFNSQTIDSLDWFQTENEDIYRFSFLEEYVGADTDSITGVSLKGKTLKENVEGNFQEKDTLLMKTNCPFYFTEGISLSNKSFISVEVEIRIQK